MADIWLISDTHFNHANILGFTDKNGRRFRGALFEDVHHMNETMVERWNARIKPQDKVYHLGDVFFGPRPEADRLLARLNGKKRLILGNHDVVYGTKGNPLQHHFQKIYLWRVFREFNMVLTHIPIMRENFRSNVEYNVHGHIHQNAPVDTVHINVCVEQTDYAPVHIEDVIKRFAAPA